MLAVFEVVDLYLQAVFNSLPEVIQHNITVKGMKWDEHAAQMSQSPSMQPRLIAN